MNLSDSPRDARFRQELRAWLEQNRPERRERAPYDDESLEEEVRFLRDWQRRLDDAGWLGILWWREYGGRGGAPTEQAMLWSRASTIAGGTSEAQLNIIAQRVLGLPKS